MLLSRCREAPRAHGLFRCGSGESDSQIPGAAQDWLLFQDIIPIQKGYLTCSPVQWIGNWRDYEPGKAHGSKHTKWLGHRTKMSRVEARQKLDKLLRKTLLARTKPDRPLTRSTLGRIVQELGRRANLGMVNPHMLRHSFATHMLERGADIRAIQELLGHSYLTSTQVYTQISNNAIASTFRKFHPRAA